VITGSAVVKVTHRNNVVILKLKQPCCTRSATIST
jgi:hypothetical protein